MPFNSHAFYTRVQHRRRCRNGHMVKTASAGVLVQVVKRRLSFLSLFRSHQLPPHTCVIMTSTSPEPTVDTAQTTVDAQS